MTGVRARRVDGAEVKLDTASYRLRDRFFGSRVGRRALMAVALTFGRRGMALLEFQLRMRRLVGERVRSAQGSSKGLSNELHVTFSVRVRSAYGTQAEQIQLCSGASSSHVAAETTEKDRRNGARRTLERRRRFFVIARVWFYAQRAAWASSQNQRANWLLPLKRAGVGHRQVAGAVAKRELRLSPARHPLGPECQPQP